MKSRWTTYLLLSAVVGVWGVVAWKIFSPANIPISPPPISMLAEQPAVHNDTLMLNYPDPFLKGASVCVKIQRPTQLLPRPVARIKRERVKMIHLGTIAAKGRILHIMQIGNEQYEAGCGEVVGSFVVSGADNDSIYLTKQGLTYGIKRCE